MYKPSPSDVSGLCFSSISSVSYLVERGGWMLGWCPVSHLVPQDHVPLRQLPLQRQVTGLNSHPHRGCHRLMDGFLCCRSLSRFPHLAFLQVKVTKMAEYWNKNPVLKYYVEGNIHLKCIPLFYFQMVYFKIWSELMAIISKFQVCYKLKFKENYAALLNYFQILKS